MTYDWIGLIIYDNLKKHKGIVGCLGNDSHVSNIQDVML